MHINYPSCMHVGGIVYTHLLITVPSKTTFSSSYSYTVIKLWTDYNVRNKMLGYRLFNVSISDFDPVTVKEGFECTLTDGAQTTSSGRLFHIWTTLFMKKCFLNE